MLSTATTTTTQTTETPPRVHPLIPSQSEDDLLKYSDHVPILVNNLPVVGSVVSLNVMQISHHGDHLYGGGKSDEEFDAYQRARMDRIIEFLLRAVQENPRTTVIHLQEAHENQLALENAQDFKFLSLLKERLPEGWDFVSNERGLATFYNKNRLTIAGIEESQRGEVMRRLSLSFRDAQEKSSEVFTLHNIHAFYKHMPTVHEAQFREKLKERPSAIIGDTNLHCAPNGVSGLNLATAVADNKSDVGFTSDHVHLPDSPDAAFLCRKVGGAVEKCEFQVLDFKTGTVFQPPTDVSSLEVDERFTQFKIMPMIEEEYYNEEAPENVYLQVQQKLQESFKNNEIIVRPCVKMLDTGERGFSIAFSKSFFLENKYDEAGFNFQSLQAPDLDQYGQAIWLRVFMVPNSEKEGLLEAIKWLKNERESLVQQMDEAPEERGSFFSRCCLFSSCCGRSAADDENESLLSHNP